MRTIRKRTGLEGVTCGIDLDESILLIDDSNCCRPMRLEMIPIRCLGLNLRHGVWKIAEMDLHMRQAFAGQMRSEKTRAFVAIGCM